MRHLLFTLCIGVIASLYAAVDGARIALAPPSPAPPPFAAVWSSDSGNSYRTRSSSITYGPASTPKGFSVLNITSLNLKIRVNASLTLPVAGFYSVPYGTSYSTPLLVGGGGSMLYGLVAAYGEYYSAWAAIVAIQWSSMKFTVVGQTPTISIPLPYVSPWVSLTPDGKQLLVVVTMDNAVDWLWVYNATSCVPINDWPIPLGFGYPSDYAPLLGFSQMRFVGDDSTTLYGFQTTNGDEDAEHYFPVVTDIAYGKTNPLGYKIFNTVDFFGIDDDDNFYFATAQAAVNPGDLMGFVQMASGYGEQLYQLVFGAQNGTMYGTQNTTAKDRSGFSGLVIFRMASSPAGVFGINVADNSIFELRNGMFNKVAGFTCPPGSNLADYWETFALNNDLAVYAHCGMLFGVNVVSKATSSLLANYTDTGLPLFDAARNVFARTQRTATGPWQVTGVAPGGGARWEMPGPANLPQPKWMAPIGMSPSSGSLVVSDGVTYLAVLQ